MPDPLRESFDEVADLYDRVRPDYPEQMFDDIVELSGISEQPASRILEIACGTGQATLPLARRGYTIVAVELGTAMATIARRNLKDYPNVAVVNSAFEEWELPEEPFDLVLCATAFHWIDPDIRLSKVAAALRDGGSFALVDTHHIASDADDKAFFADSQACYRKWDPEASDVYQLPTIEDLPIKHDELDESPLFDTPVLHRYQRALTYNTDKYLDVLRTYSNIRMLSETAREGLCNCIGELIDTSYNGTVRKPYLTELCVARTTSR